MTDREKQILEIFALIIPELSENDKSYLLGLGEGMAIKVRQTCPEMPEFCMEAGQLA